MFIVKPYNRERAVIYAEKWALGRNPLFTDFTGYGGDCTNFVSQCVFAGVCEMNYTPTFGWYYINSTDRAPAWSGVEAFYDFICGVNDFPPVSSRIGPFATETASATPNTAPGDVIQLADRYGDFYHTLIISEITDKDILICSHSNDSLNRRLSTYNYASARFLHIEGCMIESAENGCFEELLDGKSLPQPFTT